MKSARVQPAFRVSRIRLSSRGLIAGLLVLLVGAVSSSSSSAEDLSREARAILSDACFQCHGPDSKSREAELRLDTREGVAGVVVPGDPAASELIRRLVSEDPDERMPPPEAKHELSAGEVDAVRRWVAAGAEWRGHWAFEPIRRPQPPVDETGWARNPVDNFVLRRLTQENLRPLAPETRERWLRRVTFDLTGLPPDIAELDAFLADDSPDAESVVLDRLLASPAYGEHMAWSWLEAARYADTNGFQGDPERTMWPWRDWVINSLNDNMPFDRFTIEQLAGDRLPNATLSQIVASGFNRNHTFNGEGGRIAEETRVENVFDRTETTATVWLGLTMTCCRCHDHKFDPLTQREYYGLSAFFNNTSEDGRPGSRRGQIPPVVKVPGPQHRARLAVLDKRLSQQAEAITAAERAEMPEVATAPAEIRRLLAVPAERRGPKDLQQLASHFQSQARYAGLLKSMRETLAKRQRVEDSVPRVMVMDDLETPRQTSVLTRGLYNKPGEPVGPLVPAVLPELSVTRPDRLALARWLTDPGQPLTARVIVNRYWQHFFGIGLVSTPEDFGVQGERPSHPELLDWLASEFVRTGWDVKHLHRLIVSSATYGQSSAVPVEQRDRLERDPANRLLARGPRRRLSSPMIRDNALAVSGLLVPEVGGEPVRPYQPEGVWAAATFGKKKYVRDTGSKLYRRSIYTFWRRIVGPTMFFDVARRQTCEVRTTQTNTPLHALLTMNDITFVEAARHLAQRVMRAESEPEQQIARAFRLVTSRHPRSDEMQLLRSRLERLREQYSAAPQAAEELLRTGDSPRDASPATDKHAAMTALCLLLLNLDEALNR